MRRIVFAAIAGYTERPTADGRMLVTPEGPLLHRPYPLPVHVWANVGRAVGRERFHVGHIEHAAVCDHRLIVFGRLFTDEATRPYVDALAAGKSWFVIGLDQAKTQHVWPEGVDLEDLNVHPVVRMTSWQLGFAYIGEDPCWGLPPVQIEEFTT